MFRLPMIPWYSKVSTSAGETVVLILQRAGNISKLFRLRHFHRGGINRRRLFLFDGKFDRVDRRFGAEVVHAGFEAALPSVEMHGGELGEVGFLDEEIQRLGLADESSAVGGHVDE